MKFNMMPALMAGLVALVEVSADAAVIFSQFTIDEVSTQNQLQSAAGAASTSSIPGVTLEPGAAGDIFAIHLDTALAESFVRVNPEGGAATRLTDAATIGAQLGAPYGSALELAGGFAFSEVAGELVFGEDFYGSASETSLIALNAETGAARLVTRTANLSGLSDLAIMPDGTVTVARSAPASVAGTVNPQTGAYVSKVTEADLLAASPGATGMSPEAITANPVSGSSYLWAHGDGGLFNVDDFTAADPSAVLVTNSALSGIDLHDLAVDQYGNLYGLDVAAGTIVIIRSTDKSVFTFPLSQIAMALGRPAFAAVPWRGIAARISGYGRADLFLSSGDSNYGIVRVRFGAVASGVADWTVY